MQFTTPTLTEAEFDVVNRIEQIRSALRYQLTQPSRWLGVLRRVTLGRAIRASNSIEGYDVDLDEAVHAAEGEPPADPETEAWRAVLGYRDAMTYVLQLADDPHFEYDESLIRGLHFMMLKYDLSKSPGRWRPGPVHVQDERVGEIVYTGPDAPMVPDLMGEFVADLLRDDPGIPVMIRAAMAHLNLVMVHPFRDGNGRMARCLQTLVLSREGVLEAPFVSIEEYLAAGTNTDEYYRVLAQVGGGNWQPQRDARPWIRFILTAHYRQAQTLVIRTQEAEGRWGAVAQAVEDRELPERSISALFNASMGFRIRNRDYQDYADVSDSLASRDLRALVQGGLLIAVGERRGRFYRAAPALVDINRSVTQERKPIEDPFDDAPVPRNLGR